MPLVLEETPPQLAILHCNLRGNHRHDCLHSCPSRRYRLPSHRSNGHLVIWLVSAELDILLNRIFPLTTRNQKPLFWCTYAKDLIATCTTMGGIIATQIGLFNRCSCYTQWGRTGLALPEMPDVAAVLRKRLGREYPAIIFTFISIQLLIVPMAIWLWYGDAMRVFVQRDDDKSNAKWLWRLSRFRHELVSSTKKLFCGLRRKSRWGKKL